MVSPTGKSSSFKEEEASKPKEKEKEKEQEKEKVVVPLPSQSVPLEETMSNGDAASTEGDAISTEDVEASPLELELFQLQREVDATKFKTKFKAKFKAIQQEPLSVLENGMSTDHRWIWIATDILTHLMLRSSTQRLPSGQQVSECLRTARTRSLETAADF
jgi:hypothetical protein